MDKTAFTFSHYLIDQLSDCVCFVVLVFCSHSFVMFRHFILVDYFDFDNSLA